MKKLLIFLILLTLARPCGAAAAFTDSIAVSRTWLNGFAWTGHVPKDRTFRWAKEVENKLDGDTALDNLYFDSRTSDPTSTEGRIYYNTTSNTIKYYNGSSWISLTGLPAGASGTLDDAYNSGNTIDVDGDAVTMTTSDTDNNVVLAIAQNEATNDNDALTITFGAGAIGKGILINSQTSGTDIAGDNWSVAQTGALICVGVDTTGTVTLANDETILNDTDGEIQFAGNGTEDVSFGFGTSNTLTWTTDTSVATVAWGDLDSHTGITDITGDAADFTLKITADAGGEDLIINQAGGVDGSIQLLSAGTGADAIDIETSAGGIYLESTGASKDIHIDATAGSVTVDGGEAHADAIHLKTTNAAGGLNMDVGSGNLDIDVTGGDITIDNDGAGKNLDIDISAGSIYLDAGEADAKAIWLAATAGGVDIDTVATYDIDMDASGGKILLTATENAANTIALEENGGTSGGINLYANQGNGSSATTEHDASIQLQSDAGGIGLYTTGNVADAVRIETNGGTSETVVINNLQGTGAGAITISANAAGGDLNLDSVLGRIEIEAEENVANALYLIADGGTTTTLEIFNDTGTSVTQGAASIQLLSDAGGIAIQSDGDLDDAIVIIADGGTTAEITIHNDQGTATDSIDIVSDDGGILITAGKPVVITNAFELDIVLVPDGAAYDVLANNSGQVHLIPDQTGDLTMDLPAEADGLYYKFVYVGGAADVQDWLIDSENNTNFYIGGVVQHDPDAGGDDTTPYYSDGDSNSILGVLTPECGTVIEIWCDGVNWRVTGTAITATDTGVTFSD